MVRVVVGLVVGAAAAAVGGVLLGEYDFEGMLPWLAGPIMAVVVAELAAEIGRRRTAAVGAIAGALAGGGLLWAAWISTGEGLEPLPATVWPAMALAVGAGAAWLGVGSSSQRRAAEAPVSPEERRPPG
jgi:hypothetical protein